MLTLKKKMVDTVHKCTVGGTRLVTEGKRVGKRLHERKGISTHFIPYQSRARAL